MKILAFILGMISTFSGLLGMIVAFPAMEEQIRDKPNKVWTKTFIICIILEVLSIYTLYKYFDPYTFMPISET